MIKVPFFVFNFTFKGRGHFDTNVNLHLNQHRVLDGIILTYIPVYDHFKKKKITSQGAIFFIFYTKPDFLIKASK
jgi:hypothetical protein